MAQTARGLPYPTDAGAQALARAAFTDLAVAADSALDVVAAQATAANSNANTKVAKTQVTVGQWTIPKASLTAAAAKNGATITQTFGKTFAAVPRVVVSRRSNGLHRQWAVYVSTITTTGATLWIGRMDAVETAGADDMIVDVIAMDPAL